MNSVISRSLSSEYLSIYDSLFCRQRTSQSLSSHLKFLPANLGFCSETSFKEGIPVVEGQQESNEGDSSIVKDILHGLRELGEIYEFKRKTKTKKTKDLRRMFKMGIHV